MALFSKRLEVVRRARGQKYPWKLRKYFKFIFHPKILPKTAKTSKKGNSRILTFFLSFLLIFAVFGNFFGWKINLNVSRLSWIFFARARLATFTCLLKKPLLCIFLLKNWKIVNFCGEKQDLELSRARWGATIPPMTYGLKSYTQKLVIQTVFPTLCPFYDKTAEKIKAHCIFWGQRHMLKSGRNFCLVASLLFG